MADSNINESVLGSSALTSINPFTFIHKSIRLLLAETLVELGCTDFTNRDSAQRALEMLDHAFEYCEQHLEHEERFVRPACAGRLSLDVFDRGHPEQERMLAQLRMLMASLHQAESSHAQRLGAALCLQFSAFVAECLAHMAEEEQVLAPVMVQALSEDELGAMQGRIVQSMSPDEATRGAYLMLIAANRSERRILLEKLLLQAPRAQVLALVEQARPRLGQDEYTNLQNWLYRESNAA
jgi:hypothetical protein